MSEDCLFLNVYTKKVQNNEITSPVLVYIHGGSFNFGTSNIDVRYFMEYSDLVIVTINYRLGALGFLSLGTKEVPGNLGFKDQVLALKWIKKNIIHFGGNPNDVTLLGFSAGAMSVALHTISPMSEGLFKNVILMSGGLQFHTKTKYEQIDLAKKQAKLLNCSEIEAPKGIYDCIKSADMNDIVKTIPYMFEYVDRYPYVLWHPVIEKDFGQQRFLIEDPIETLKKKNFSNIHVINGITKDELYSQIWTILSNEKALKQLDEEFDTTSQICFGYENNSMISSQLWNEYNLTHPLSENNQDKLLHLFSDILIGFGAKKFSDILQTTTDVYFYRFSYTGSIYKPYVKHYDDFKYLFPDIDSYTEENDSDTYMVKFLITLWSQFASTGNPNNNRNELTKNVTWPLYKENTSLYLDIGKVPTVKDHLYKNRYNILEKLFPLEL